MLTSLAVAMIPDTISKTPFYNALPFRLPEFYFFDLHTIMGVKKEDLEGTGVFARMQSPPQEVINSGPNVTRNFMIYLVTGRTNFNNLSQATIIRVMNLTISIAIALETTLKNPRSENSEEIYNPSWSGKMTKNGRDFYYTYTAYVPESQITANPPNTFRPLPIDIGGPL